MIAIQQLDASSGQPFIPLVRPGLRQKVLELNHYPNLLVFGVYYWGQPAGAVVAHHTSTAIELLDLYVLPAYRNAGIGTALLAAVEGEAQRLSIDKAQTLYRPDDHTPAFARVLAKRGWQPPNLKYIVFWTTHELDALNLDWIQRYRFRPPYEVVSWPEISAEERCAIVARGQNGWYPTDLDPFSRPIAEWDAETSLGLRYHGEIVGWVLTVREAPLQLLIEILFVDPPLQRLGKGFMLIGEVTRRCWEIGMDDMYWRASPDNEPMLRWSRKAFKDTLSDEFEEWYSEKTLHP